MSKNHLTHTLHHFSMWQTMIKCSFKGFLWKQLMLEFIRRIFLTEKQVNLLPNPCNYCTIQFTIGKKFCRIQHQIY